MRNSSQFSDFLDIYKPTMDMMGLWAIGHGPFQLYT